MKSNATAVPILGAAAGAVGTALGLAWYVSQQINPLPRRSYLDSYTFTPWELQVPFEHLAFPTSDGLMLRGWWLPRPAAQSVIITCHGHTGSKPDMLGIGSGLWRAGYAVLLFDFRGRGQSDPWPNTLISREVDDLLAAVAWVRARQPEARIGVTGFSMGAAVALLAAAQSPHIAAVVADSPFASADAVVAHLIRQRMPVLHTPLFALTRKLIDLRHGYNLGQVRPVDAAACLTPRPLLLIHGTEDSMIPIAHTHAIFAAAQPPKELWLYPDVEHCGAYFADRSGYVQRVSNFFGACL